MKYKIGIFGSNADKDEAPNRLSKSIIEDFSKSFSKHKLTLITGACSGIPYQVAQAAAKNGIDVIGYSPQINLEYQRLYVPNDDLSIYKKLIFIPKSFPLIKNKKACLKYRNVISTANCDAGIIISGRWGTLNEFTNLFDMGKIIGVLTKTGGIADELPMLTKKIRKKSSAIVIFESQPNILIDKIVKELKLRK
jgi:predicted Rossmann-fold nucleotide-binding protein